MSNPAIPWTQGGLPLHVKVLLGFVVGALLGLAAHFYAADATWTHNAITYGTKPLGQIFLNLLFMLGTGAGSGGTG
jgi:Na+/H+-dicarboxylate symporter